MSKAADEFKVNNFDLLRILAALQVVLAHTRVHLDIQRLPLWSLVEAFPGVPIFFAISGFLISASFERTPNLASYVQPAPAHHSRPVVRGLRDDSGRRVLRLPAFTFTGARWPGWSAR